MWKVWKKKIATDNVLKRRRINIFLGYWCCDVRNEEIITHLFLTSPITERLWRQFAIFASIAIYEMGMAKLIQTWWTTKITSKLDAVCKVVPAILIWCLWKRRNEIKHGGRITFDDLVWQVQDLIRKVVKVLYPWLKIGKVSWPDTVTFLRRYRPRLVTAPAEALAVVNIVNQDGMRFLL